MLLDSPIQITALSGRLLVVFCVYTWLVQLPLYYRIICIVNSFVSADRRATARTTTSLSHAAIRQKKNLSQFRVSQLQIKSILTDRFQSRNQKTKQTKRREIIWGEKTNTNPKRYKGVSGKSQRHFSHLIAIQTIISPTASYAVGAIRSTHTAKATFKCSTSENKFPWKQIPDIEIPAHQYKTVCIHQWKYETNSNHRVTTTVSTVDPANQILIELLPGSALSHLDHWSRNNDLSLVSGISIVASSISMVLLPCAVSSTWPLFNDWDDAGPPPAITSRFWVTWNIYVWDLLWHSVSPCFLGVFLCCFGLLFVGLWFLVVFALFRFGRHLTFCSHLFSNMWE